MILCAYKEQIMLLSKLNSFEVDMSYKRIRQKNINEVVFATYLHEHGKGRYFITSSQLFGNHLQIALVITLMRVFTNQETMEGYYLLFKRVFTLVQKTTGQRVEFNSIHGSGIAGIIVDMDTKQYTGRPILISSLETIQ
jgi:hypothetical protein